MNHTYNKMSYIGFSAIMFDIVSSIQIQDY